MVVEEERKKEEEEEAASLVCTLIHDQSTAFHLVI